MLAWSLPHGLRHEFDYNPGIPADLFPEFEEALLGFKRAGADGILSYFALEAARKLNGS